MGTREGLLRSWGVGPGWGAGGGRATVGLTGTVVVIGREARNLGMEGGRGFLPSDRPFAGCPGGFGETGWGRTRWRSAPGPCVGGRAVTPHPRSCSLEATVFPRGPTQSRVYKQGNDSPAERGSCPSGNWVPGGGGRGRGAGRAVCREAAFWGQESGPR